MKNNTPLLTAEKLSKIYNINLQTASEWLPSLQEAFNLAEINTIQRMASFLAQIGHESGRLKYSRELWGPTKQQLKYEGTDLAKQLGNTEQGDGFKYRGAGLIQITGRYNYRMMYMRLVKFCPDCPNFEEHPEKMVSKKWACLTAAMYWKMHNLNMYADNGDFLTQTKKINGGTNGMQDRTELFIRALSVL